MATSSPSAVRIRLTRRVARSEWPPSSKKLSSIPTFETPRVSAKSVQRISSCGERGARQRPLAHRKIWRRQRFAIQLAIRALRAEPPAPRSPPAPCNQAGFGQHECARARDRPSGRFAPLHSPPAACRPRRSSRPITAACATEGWRARTASISPGSMRKPRILSCWSARPRNSSTPSARHRARSPVRYIRVPGAP